MLRLLPSKALAAFVALAALAVAPFLGASEASAVAITSGGLATSIACPDGSNPCSTAADFTLDPPNPVKAAVGSITFNPGSADISLTVASYSMTGSAGSVTDLDFTSVVYTATVPTTEIPFGGGIVQINQVPGLATGSVSGTYDQIGGPGSGPFSDLSVSFSDLTCLLVNGEGQCGFNVGALSAAADLGLDVDGSPYDVVQAFNVVVPEPSTIALLGAGLLGLAVQRRR